MESIDAYCQEMVRPFLEELGKLPYRQLVTLYMLREGLAHSGEAYIRAISRRGISLTLEIPTQLGPLTCNLDLSKSAPRPDWVKSRILLPYDWGALDRPRGGYRGSYPIVKTVISWNQTRLIYQADRFQDTGDRLELPQWGS